MVGHFQLKVIFMFYIVISATTVSNLKNHLREKDKNKDFKLYPVKPR